jgi:Na+/melibiose symporter-like transporter
VSSFWGPLQQWIGQIGLFVASIFLGWLLGAFVPTRENLDKLRKLFKSDRPLAEEKDNEKRTELSNNRVFLIILLIFMLIILGLAIVFTIYAYLYGL